MQNNVPERKNTISDLLSEPIENVAIIVGDAVRWDHVKSELGDMGVTFKTVAASTHTPTSFATMLTGVPPYEHGVYGFHQNIGCIDSLFNHPDHNVYFGNGDANSWLSSKQKIFGEKEQKPISKVESPFIWVDRDFGGHAPYNRFSEGDTPKLNTGENYTEITSQEYLDEAAGDLERVRKEYRYSINSFLKRVRDLRGYLRSEGLLKNTLIIITSDHGELLGEYGHIGHDYPMAPELVYVPTTFVHPSLGNGFISEEGVARHIDLYPTISRILGYDVKDSLPGKNLCEEKLASYGMSFYNRSLSDYFYRIAFDYLGNGEIANYLPDINMNIQGYWEKNSGYVFNRSNFIERFLYVVFRTFIMAQGKHILRTNSIKEAWLNLFTKEKCYNTPSKTKKEAEDAIESALNTESRQRRDSMEYDEDQLDQLEDLGYI